jgi:hypothetical protein
MTSAGGGNDLPEGTGFPSVLCLTIDIDWAPDFAIDLVAEHLVSRKVRSTWFVTHLSPAVARLRRYPELFELGIHPNFLPGSTHGDTPAAILRHCMALVPDATSMRTHALVQSTPLLEQILKETPVVADASLFLPGTPFLCPVEYQWSGRRMIRVPYFWEDDYEIQRRKSCWRLASLLSCHGGLKVFDFHPIHVFLNSIDEGPYRALKKRYGSVGELVCDQAQESIHTGEGTRTLFFELVERLATVRESLTVRDICGRWMNRVEMSRTREVLM